MVQRASFSALMVVVALSAPAKAQEGVDALLKGAPKGYNAALEGERLTGLYFSDRYGGRSTVRVERPPAGSGAVYQVTSRVQMQLPGFTQDLTVVALLDERFGLVDLRHDEKGTRTRQRHQFREGGAWVREDTEDGETTRKTIATTQPDYSDVVVSYMIEAAGGPKPGTYRLPSIDWPKDGEAAQAHLEVTVEALAPYEHRGATVQASSVLLVDPDGDRTRIALDSAGRLLQMRPEGEGAPPIRMTAGTAEQLEADAVPAEPPAVGTPLHAVQVLFEGMAKMRPVEELEAVVDWAAVQALLGERDPNVKALTPEAFSKLMMNQFKGARGPTREQVELLVPMLKCEVEGDEARVVIPGQERPVMLRRDGERWLITRLPGM